MSGGPFPRKHIEVSSYFDRVAPYLNTHAGRLSVSAANLSALNKLYDNAGVAQSKLGWKQLWPLYADKATVNKTIREIMKKRRKEMEKALRNIYGDIPQSALTANDRNTLHLSARDSEPTTVQPVDFAPSLSFKKVTNGIQIVRIKNPQTPESNAMPPGQKAEVQSFTGEAGLADKAVPFAPLQDSGRHLLKVEYPPAAKGKTAYYRARYKTATGKTGPWSDVVSELVL